MLAEYFVFLIISQFFVLFSYVNCQKKCVFLFKSNEGSSWSGQSFPVFNDCLDFLFFCPNFIELKERDVSSSGFQALYQLTVVEREGYVRNDNFFYFFLVLFFMSSFFSVLSFTFLFLLLFRQFF
jgi:hypothetical protein